MKKTVLLYNFSAERLKAVRRALTPLGCSVRCVSKKEFSQPVGALAGLSDVSCAADKKITPENDFSDEMLVICGFSGDGIDVFLNALKYGGVGRIALKAVLTEHNASWSGSELHRELKSEHDFFNSRF